MENIEKHEIKSLKVKTISIILSDYFKDIENKHYYTASDKITAIKMLLKEIRELEEEYKNEN